MSPTFFRGSIIVQLSKSARNRIFDTFWPNSLMSQVDQREISSKPVVKPDGMFIPDPIVTRVLGVVKWVFGGSGELGRILDIRYWILGVGVLPLELGRKACRHGVTGYCVLCGK
jgi:hypothetical protein